jgi:hypothetical protein
MQEKPPASKDIMCSSVKHENSDEYPGSYFRQLRNKFLGKKYLTSLMLIRIRNILTPDPGYGMEKFGSGINIPDPKH